LFSSQKCSFEIGLGFIGTTLLQNKIVRGMGSSNLKKSLVEVNNYYDV